MGTLLQDIRLAADSISEALKNSGYNTDFSPDSVREIERFIADNINGEAVTGLLAEDTGKRVFALGAYLGETLRRNLGGEWKVDENDPEAEMNATLVLPENRECWPVLRVMNRITEGDTDSITHYGQYFGLPVTGIFTK